MIQQLLILKNYARVRRALGRFRSREELEAWQDRQVVRHLRRILPKSEFLRHRFGDLPVERWRELPVTGKAEMMANFDRLNTARIRLDDAMAVALKAEETRDFAPMIGNIAVGLSSGTSGARGVFLASAAERAAWAGSILARALPRSIFEKHRIALFLRANSPLYTAIGSRRIQFEFFDLLEPVESQVDRLNRFDPTTLVGPPSLLGLLAESARLRIAPEKVISAAEVLEPRDRERIGARFGEPVHQIYQATEGFLGASRADGRVVLCEENLVIEKEWIDRELGAFTPIVTDFRRTTQPIVRHRLDDVLIEHRGGSVFTVLDRIEGRCDDLLDFGGVRVFPDFVRRAILAATEEIEDYRVQQLLDGSLEIALLGPASAQQAVRGSIGQLAKRLGAVAPEIRFVDWTPRDFRLGQKLRRVSRTKI